ncbi:MAG: hypothetical protein AAGI53_06180 [Planctomycetota bacterium]
MQTDIRILTNQIMVGAFTLGLVIFAGVAVMITLTSSSPGFGERGGEVGMIVMGVAAGLFVVGQIIATLARSGSIKSLRNQLPELSESRTEMGILNAYGRAAMTRGILALVPGMIFTVAPFLTGSLEALIGTGLCAVTALLFLPTKGGLEAFRAKVTDG